ncbi:MAG: hypothetical protein C4289_15915 [Chloroflexota bacterium]
MSIATRTSTFAVFRSTPVIVLSVLLAIVLLAAVIIATPLRDRFNIYGNPHELTTTLVYRWEGHGRYAYLGYSTTVTEEKIANTLRTLYRRHSADARKGDLVIAIYPGWVGHNEFLAQVTTSTEPTPSAIGWVRVRGNERMAVANAEGLGRGQHDVSKRVF